MGDLVSMRGGEKDHTEAAANGKEELDGIHRRRIMP